MKKDGGGQSKCLASNSIVEDGYTETTFWLNNLKADEAKFPIKLL